LKYQSGVWLEKKRFIANLLICLKNKRYFKGATNTDLIVLIDVIIEKALTKDGDKMFNSSHILKFKTKADTNIIAEVATKIMGTGNSDLEDNKKN
tara:strand:+ start:290 stop:574 length:285 start_codon:yes stop_codon:yes gene_type:complete